MAQNWLIVIGKADALKWVLDNQRMAFRSHVKTELLRELDRFAIYTSRGAYGNSAKDDAQILALGNIASATEPAEVEVGAEVFPKSCAISLQLVLPLRQGVNFRSLIPRLGFIKSEREWPSAMHRTLVSVDDADYRVVTEAAYAKSDGI